MGYQSEAQLGQQLIEDLNGRGYGRIKINDMDELVANFRIQLNIFNNDHPNGNIIPSYLEQQLNSEIFQKNLLANVKIETEKKILETWQSIKKGLMQRMFV
jgi:type I restriction enzyme R subunit